MQNIYKHIYSYKCDIHWILETRVVILMSIKLVNLNIPTAHLLLVNITGYNVIFNKK